MKCENPKKKVSKSNSTPCTQHTCGVQRLMRKDLLLATVARIFRGKNQIAVTTYTDKSSHSVMILEIPRQVVDDAIDLWGGTSKHTRYIWCGSTGQKSSKTSKKKSTKSSDTSPMKSKLPTTKSSSQNSKPRSVISRPPVGFNQLSAKEQREFLSRPVKK